MSKSGVRFGGVFFVEGYDKHGRKKWEDYAHNKVVNQGIQKLLDVGFVGSTYISPWYVGLMDSTGILATHTMAAHTGWNEATEISDANRPAYVETRSAQTLTNSAAKSTFNINKDATTVDGAFLVSSNTIGGSAGVLMCGAPFSAGGKACDSGDKLVVTYTFVGSDDTSS